MKFKNLYSRSVFKKIRNLNEERVLEMIPIVLKEYTHFNPTRIDVEDIYALALNKLPARYVQDGSIPFDDMVTDQMVEEAVRKAAKNVTRSPTLPENEDDLSLDNM